MDHITYATEWQFEIRPYDPSEAPKHFPFTDEYSGILIKSKDVSKQ